MSAHYKHTTAPAPTAECTNGEGSFQCECKQGFTGDGETCNGTFKYN